MKAKDEIEMNIWTDNVRHAWEGFNALKECSATTTPFCANEPNLFFVDLTLMVVENVVNYATVSLPLLYC